jgi:hypothetical protein
VRINRITRLVGKLSEEELDDLHHLVDKLHELLGRSHAEARG